MINPMTQIRSPKRACRAISGLLVAVGLLGAAWLAPAARADWPWPFQKKEEKPGKPDKIITLWSDTILTQPGRPPLRGFGGRLMFFEGKSEEPVKIDGTLVVYAFDESNREANNSKPDRKFVFLPEQLPAHYSKSKIGHSYSVWLPWDEIGGVQKEFTLIVRFQPKEGNVAVSDPVRQLLPGRVVPTPDKSASGGMLIPTGIPHVPDNGYGIQPAAYQTAITDGAGVVQPQWQQRRLATTTIDLPSGSTIRSELSLPRPAAGPSSATAAGYYQPAAGPAPGQNYPPQPPNYQNYPGQNYPARNYPQNQPQQNYPPQGFGPVTQSQPPMNQQGQQLQSGFVPGRQWPLGEPLARLNRDRAPTQLPPAGSPSFPASGPGQGPANAAPAGQQGGSQWPN
jgi:hypothetical protein